MDFLQSKLIKTKHFFTTRFGGVSKEPFDELNLAFHVGDNRDSVIQNHKIVASYFGYDFKKLIFMNQIHSNKVVLVDDDFYGIASCDGLVTNLKNTPLMVMSADCSGVLYHDEKKGVIAVAHIGRKGAFLNINENIIKTMQNRFNSDPKDIKVAISPNIKQCCYEVSEDIAKEANNLGYGFAIKDSFLDIDSIIKYQLDELGIKDYEFIDICTRCNSDRFYSYRANKTTGRFASVIMLED